jgi:beta-lactamase superfamily II metal-dependent hydrolase
MSNLNVTLIDVGWGDSVLIESTGQGGESHYGLVDSNDDTYLRSSYLFLKRFFEKAGKRLPGDKPIFDFVLLSHAHADHGKGLKESMREFGTRNFWYPKSLNWSSLADLIRYANLSSNVEHHQSIDDTKILPDLGDASMEILWPPRDQIDQSNENNNSVVLVLRLNQVAVVLTGDAEEPVWNQIGARIPGDTLFFKVPHHGSVNGTFDDADNTPWFDNCPSGAHLAISSHVRPFGHPHQKVIDLFSQQQRAYYRTDEHYHITLRTDGAHVNMKYSHV